jgi:hypothetical protein
MIDIFRIVDDRQVLMEFQKIDSVESAKTAVGRFPGLDQRFGEVERKRATGRL